MQTCRLYEDSILKTDRSKILQKALQVTSISLKGLDYFDLIFDVKGRDVIAQICMTPIEISQVMADNPSQIAVKRLKCCNILGPEMFLIFHFNDQRLQSWRE